MTGDDALRTDVGAVRIERDAVAVRGPDALTFLQGQLSQDLAILAVGSSVDSLLLQPTGRMVARQLGVFARFEVEHAAERQQRAKLQAASDGRWTGSYTPAMERA